MKLLLCPDCGDVFNLSMRWKTCVCGYAGGQYVDQINAVYTAGTPIGFGNTSFVKAVRNQPESGNGFEFTAFVIPKECATFKPTQLKKPLVNFLADAAKMPTSVARRQVVQGAVKVNGEVVDNPEMRLCDEPGHPSVIEYNGEVYPFYP